MNIIKYIDETSLLIIDKTGHLKRIYCPFLVTLKVDESPVKKIKGYEVTKIVLGKGSMFYYKIGDGLQAYNKFLII